MDNRLLLNYALPILTAVFACFILAKDWEAHKNSCRRLGILIIIFMIGIIGVFNAYYNDIQNRKGQETLGALKTAAETSNKNQVENTKRFLDNFNKMYQEISNLQSRVDNEELQKHAEDLQKQLISTQKELVSTQKALIKPEASLTFTFGKLVGNSPPIQVVTLPVVNDIVHVEYSIINTTHVEAKDGVLFLEICKSCEFASEPKNSKKFPGESNSRRSLAFINFRANAQSELMSVDIKVPNNYEHVAFGINYRCTTCDSPDPGSNIGKIFLSR